MAVSVVMPALELAQETGKVLVWIKKEGDNVVKGFSDQSWAAALDSAGYPRTRAPGQSPTRPTSPPAPATPAPVSAAPTAGAQAAPPR